MMMLRAPRGIRRIHLAILAIPITLITYTIIYQQQDVYGLETFPDIPKWFMGFGSTGSDTEETVTPLPPWKISDNHPISQLIDDAYVHFSRTLEKESQSLESAARRYRERRGRHPPPGFDAWFEAAKKNSAIVVEEFFDRVYHDINPFWAVDPLEMRRQVHGQPQLIRVRNGSVKYLKLEEDWPEWLQFWTKLMEEMLPHLPDLDMAINKFDETRILVPWENITEYAATEQRSRGLFSPHLATDKFTDYSDLDNDPPSFKPDWINDPTRYWDYFRATCPPDSPSSQVSSLADYGHNVDNLYPNAPLHYTRNGFIQNVTASRNACFQPHLRGMHGTFVRSTHMSTLTNLFPMFGGCKLPQNNEILIPGAEYLTDNELYSGGTTYGGAWKKKLNEVVWRGAASGGFHTEENWFHFQRHRFVQMMNSTTISQVEGGNSAAGPSFKLIPADHYNIPAQKEGKLGAWLSRFSNVGFGRLDCFPEEHGFWGQRLICSYIKPYFTQVKTKPMREQYNYKYLPDVDGNSYSARYRGFLLSSSCILKATIFSEWHDDRLFPWLHFAPFDNSFMDIYGIMDYFLNGHDSEAQRIAQEGAEWANKVLRKEDMMLYTWRVLLEYARVVDPKRDRLGYVQDLLT